MKKQKIQTVTIVLSNGKQGTFSGEAICCTKDQEKGVCVSSIKFSQPRELPEGFRFSIMNFDYKPIKSKHWKKVSK